MNALLPSPKVELKIRLATLDDLPFIDGLHKAHAKQVGWMPTKTFEGKIALKQVLIAEMLNSPTPVGYLIGQDRYFKRDDVGIVYQLIVAPGKQRGFIGSALLKAMFDRSAYGCRLFCCWCAQDIEANYFWQSMGYVPLAYRNGSETKGKNGKPRVHIFWQKKIRGADDKVNWWFPAKTDQGSIRADRLVFPIPPGVHWKDVQPIEIPTMVEEKFGEEKLLESSEQLVVKTVRKKVEKPVKKFVRAPLSGGLKFALPQVEKVEEAQPVKKKKPKRTKKKIDPKFIDAARELRDRYLEEVNERGYRLESAGKYEVVRSANSEMAFENQPMMLLEVA